MEKLIGKVIVSVFKNEDGTTSFIVSSDEEVLPVSYVIEDILKLY